MTIGFSDLPRLISDYFTITHYGILSDYKSESYSA